FIRQVVQPHAHAHAHRALGAQVGKAAVHLRGRRSRPGAGARIGRPHLLVALGQVFHDGQRVPHLHVTVHQHRHAPARREALEAALAVVQVEGFQVLAEGDAQGAHQHPGTHGPGRVVLVADEELVHAGHYNPRPATGKGDSMTASSDTARLEANKKLVLEFYDAMIGRKDFEAGRKYMGDTYTQHAPYAED